MISASKRDRTTRPFADSDDPTCQISIGPSIAAELQVRHEHVFNGGTQTAELPRQRHAQRRKQEAKYNQHEGLQGG